MVTESGALSGSRPAGQAPAGLDASRIDPARLLELAERCEQAAGEDRRLGAEIEIALRGFPDRAYNQRNGMRSKGAADLDPVDFMAGWLAACPTASLDAAMTLVPEGWAVTVSRFINGAGKTIVWRASWQETHRATDGISAATPALALCAASLRAIAAGARSAET